MKKSKREAPSSLHLLLTAAVCVFTVIYAFPLGNKLASMLSTLAAVSYSNGSSSFITLGSVGVKNSQESTTEKETGVASRTDVLADESESTAVAGAESTTACVSDENGFETPEDIKSMESEYISAFAASSPAGTVTEVFTSVKGATDTLGNVSVRNATSEQKPDFAALLAGGAPLEISDISAPTVLIFHTHTTESYLLSDTGSFYGGYSTRSTSSDRNMIRVGNEICSQLEKNGIGIIHDTTIYDGSYNGAYQRSREGILKILEENPSIKIVLDVHRDAIYNSSVSRIKPVAVINGKKAAQVMIITGAQEGLVTSFPDWESNLRFALALQSSVQNMYEGLMKPICFCQRRYNMDVAKCSLLLEFGSDANTLGEAVYSGYLFGDALSSLVKAAAAKTE